MLTLAAVLCVPTSLTPVWAAGRLLDKPDVPKAKAGTLRPLSEKAVEKASGKAREKRADSRTDNARREKKAHEEQRAAWPKAATARGRLAGGTPVGGGTVPVQVLPGGKATKGRASHPASGDAQITVLDREATHRAGVTGVIFTAAADQGGTAQITVDYSDFGSAVGGDWAGRLGIVQLPDCVLTTPAKAACSTGKQLESVNNAEAQTVAASVTLANAQSEAVFAVTAVGAASATGSGDYAASPLPPSSTWASGQSSGAFAWSYPIAVPPAAAGPGPELEFSYDSGSIDGRTANTNNQGSQVGEGFDLSSSYITRTYGSCDDDGQEDKHDLCWKYENATLVLNGRASELVKDDTTGQWRLKNDDDSVVVHHTDADNGDDDGEYWTLTTSAGSTYTFGLNKLPGAGSQRTESVWTVPVFGDDSGEPGYSSGTSLDGRAKTQAWRWNLDLIEDTAGNAASYWYTPETNHYAKLADKTKLASYTRGGYLKEIQYGQRSGTLFTGVTDAKVTFAYAERCTASDCSSLTDATSDNWPDVPFDTICTASETDCKGSGPSFFTRKRLTDITTYSWSTTASAFTKVDSYALVQKFLDGGDIGNTSDQVLTLSSIRRTGENGTPAITLPPVEFTYHFRPNRVDAPGDDILPLHRPRINTITSEAGAITTVTLSGPECVRGSNMPKAEDDNAMSCYPVYWPVNGGDPQLDWFHKYNVTAVTVTDPAGQNEPVEYAYGYDSPAWRYNDSPFTKESERTWSTWRGYATVTSWTGALSGTRSKTVSRYMQGMNGDKIKAGGTRSVTTPGIPLTGISVSAVTDSEQHAGYLRQEVKYDGAQPVSSTLNTPWSRRTAVQHKSFADTEAYYTNDLRVWNYTHLTAGDTWRTTKTENTFDTRGRIVKIDASGDDNAAGDESCTRNWFAGNTAGLSLVTRVRTVSKPCATVETGLSLSADSATRGDVLSDNATVYDNPTATTWSETQTLSKGQPTWIGRPTGYPATATGNERHPSGWQKTASTTYDALGRPLAVTNADNITTSTVYIPGGTSPTDDGPLSRTTVTKPLTQKVNTYFDPARGQALRTYNVALKKTENTYDALGRITATWLPGRDRGALSANVTYGYGLQRSAQPWTSVSTLKADGATYRTTYSISDALLRPLQVQTPSANGGRLLTDTRYNSRGLTYETHAEVLDPAATPKSAYTRVEYGGSPKQSMTTFDGVGRPTSGQLLVFGVAKAETTVTYTGDSVASSALEGGTAQRTITDALGRTVETRTYSSASPADTQYGASSGATYNRVKYALAPDNAVTAITGPDNAVWSYTYDLYGRQVTAADPDKGTTRTTYTKLDQIDTVKDDEDIVTLYGYDDLGRKTDLWKTTRTDANKLAHWTFDSVMKGLPESSVRYEGGVGGKAYTKKVTAYDDLGRATATDLVLPANDPMVTSGAVTATTTTETDYLIDGAVNYTKEPTVGGLAAETVQNAYNTYALPTGVSGTTGYLLGASYSPTGQPQQYTLGTSSAAGVKKAYLNRTYEEGTDRLLRSYVVDQTHAWMPQELNYSYNQSGNITQISDPATQGGTVKPDNQCFAYDGQRRLTEAWTPKTADCSTTGRTIGNIDGAAPYWSTYSYNSAGQRTKETVHSSSGDTSRTYCYDASRPHALAATTTAASCTGVPAQYSYDDTGNTESRVEKAGSTTSQSLLWSAEGKLSKLTEGTSATDYVYDADGQLLIRRNSTSGGESVLYVGSTDVHVKGTKKWANRYYSVGGTAIALRSNETGTSKVTWLTGDHHGTTSLAIDADTQAFTKRYNTPFGAARGAATTWVDDKRFLGKPEDLGTGLTHVGAREYDPSTGQFLSVDPVLEDEIAQTLNGYSYGAQNPVANADPKGEALEECVSGMYTCTNRGTKVTGYGKNYEKVVKSSGGVFGNNYIKQQGARDRARLVSWNAGLQDVAATIEQLNEWVEPTQEAFEFFADLKKTFTDWKKSDNATLKKMGEQGTAFFESHKTADWVASASNTAWYKGASKGLGAATTLADFIVELMDGEDLITAAAKATLTGTFATQGAVLGASAGLACGPAAEICSPALGILGGYAGGEIAGYLDERFDEWGVWEWTDGLTDRD